MNKLIAAAAAIVMVLFLTLPAVSYAKDSTSEKADRLLNEKKFDEARKLLEAEYSKNNRSSETVKLLAEALLLSNKPESAIPILEDNIQKHREEPMLYYFLGSAYLNVSQWDKAIDIYNKLIYTFPSLDDQYPRGKVLIRPSAYFKLGFAYLNSKKYREALQTYERLQKIQPNYSNIYYNIGLAHKRLGELAEALDAFEKDAVKDYRGWGDLSLYELGSIYEDKKEYKEALKKYQQIIDGYPESIYSKTARQKVEEMKKKTGK